MALSVVASGTQTAVLTTEHSLHTSTLARTFVLSVDTVNMVNGDALTLRIKTRTLSGGTNRVAYVVNYAQVQGDPIKLSIPLPSAFSVEFTLQQTTGAAGRDFDWAVLSLD